MIGEFNLGGVFIPTLMLWAVIALAISLPLRALLDRAGVYRFVWHRGLFDIALVLALWGVVSATAAHFTFPP
jgi:hypothetical protein